MPRLVHLADTHLGFRQFERTTKDGLNQREADISQTFARALDQVIAVAPDVIVIAGDVFHVVRPVNATIAFAFKQMQRLRKALPATPIVIIGGNHEQPKTAGTGCILDLFTAIDDVHVATDRPARFRFGDVSILAVPEMKRIPELVPDDAPYRVLVLHGEVEGCIRAAERRLEQIPVEQLHAERWTYIALGHYHVMREVAPNACYAGSLDYTSSNPWGELQEEAAANLPGKGFIEVDLDTKQRVFHHVAPSRNLIDLASFSAAGLEPGQVDAAILAALDEASDRIGNAIMRIVVSDLALEVRRRMDTRKLRARASGAFHFRIDDRRPPKAVSVGVSAYVRRGLSLEDLLMQKLREIDVPDGVDREALSELGRKYLREAEEAASPETIQREDEHAAA